MKKKLLVIVLLSAEIIVPSALAGATNAWKSSENLLYAHEGHEHTSAEDVADPIKIGDESRHGTLEVSDNQPIPAVQLIVHSDSEQGWNLEAQTSNFRFAPEDLDQGSSPNEGHAHLYIDGVKITRLYSNWYYLESLAPGRHEITVTLNTNNHETLTRAGQPIASTAVLEVPAASH